MKKRVWKLLGLAALGTLAWNFGPSIWSPGIAPETELRKDLTEINARELELERLGYRFFAFTERQRARSSTSFAIDSDYARAFETRHPLVRTSARIAALESYARYGKSLIRKYTEKRKPFHQRRTVHAKVAAVEAYLREVHWRLRTAALPEQRKPTYVGYAGH